MEPRSLVRSALANVPVPQALLEGLLVLRVKVNGVTQQSYLTISPDRYTLYITSNKLNLSSNSSSSGSHRPSPLLGRKSPTASSSPRGLFRRRNSQSNGKTHNNKSHSSNATASTTSSQTVASDDSSVETLLFQDFMSNSSVHSTTSSLSSITSGAYTSNSSVTTSSSSILTSSSAISEHKIDIGTIVRVQRGQVTHKFELAHKARHDNSSQQSKLHSKLSTLSAQLLDDSATIILPSTGPVPQQEMVLPPPPSAGVALKAFQHRLALSIVFRNGEKTLDLWVPSFQVREQIVQALTMLKQNYDTIYTRFSTEVLLLRSMWIDVDKDKSNTLTLNELSHVLERINFTMKRHQLSQMYEKFGKMMGLDRLQRRRLGLTFEQCCTFMHKIKRDTWTVKPVHTIWNDLFGPFMNNGKPRTTVSAKTFLDKFLHAKQKETNVTLEQVEQLFERLHKMEYAAPTQFGNGKNNKNNSLLGNNDSDHNHDNGLGDTHQDDYENNGAEGPHHGSHHRRASSPYSRIDKNQFEAYLLSRENDAFCPQRQQFDERVMTKPISEYWINSSHNTYLTGDQFTSHSSVEMYMNSLYRGCRCLELDIWDSGEVDPHTRRPIPVVWHGHTMTTKILFSDILICLRLFMQQHEDSYPLVLSFENHCSIPYQQVMAQDLEHILGDLLYIPTEESLFGRLPSPEDLRGLIVIKGRRPDGTYEDDDDSDEGSDDELERGSEYTRSTSISSLAVVNDPQPPAAAPPAASKNTKIAPALARLTLFHGCKLKNWEHSLRNPTHHMHSFSENKVKKFFRKGTSRKWAAYNQTHMSRVYPAGARVDSSNYSPMLAWSGGCQMVALNFQTPDAPLKLNHGRFRENGGCGYVLKPSTLVMKDDFSPLSAPVRLSIRILSGSCLPKARGQRVGDCIHPYVKLSVHDVKNEERDIVTMYQTTVVQDNGYFPIWHYGGGNINTSTAHNFNHHNNCAHDGKYTFVVENGIVAMLLLEVYSRETTVVGGVAAKDEYIAHSAIPLSCLRQGYRSVPLFDAAHDTKTGPFEFATLFIEVKMRHVVAEI